MNTFLSTLFSVILGLLGGIVVLFLLGVIAVTAVIGVRAVRKEWKKDD